MNLNKSKIDVIFTDFDGVLTDNKFYLNANGDESVRLNRSDGLAFDYLNNLKIPIFIIKIPISIIKIPIIIIKIPIITIKIQII